MSEAAQTRFKGFSSPYYTQVPDILFDELLAELTGAELKVLLYIIRRTFGFKKDSDNISLRQMVTGITLKDGTVLDRGTGLNKDTVIRAIRSLEEQGVLRKTRRASQAQGDEATTYELVMEEGVGKSDTGGSRKIRHGGVGKSDTQYTVIQEIEYSNNSKVKVLEKEEPGAGEPTIVTTSHTQPLYTRQSPPELRYDSAAALPKLTEERQEDSFHAAFHDPQKGFAAIRDVVVKRQPASPDDDARATIAAFVKDMAVEFHDRAPIKSSVTRACNLFTRASVSMEAFMGRLFEARSITKERQREGRIRSGHSSMGYFFSVLGERLGLKEGTVEGVGL